MESNSNNSAGSQKRVYQAKGMAGMRAVNRGGELSKDEAEAQEEADRSAEERERKAADRKIRTGMKTETFKLRAPIAVSNRLPMRR